MRRSVPFHLASLSLWLAAGCWSSAQRGTPAGAGGEMAPAGSSGAAGSGAAGTGGALPPVVRHVGASGLPIPAAGGVAKPAGTPGNLKVLDWAGFKAAVTWTFDDSQPSQIAHYAELNAVGVPVTFYISSGLGGSASYDAAWAQAVRDGHEIGNHSVNHCHADLTGCSFGSPAMGATVAQQLDDCTTYIKQHTPQTDVWTAASPFGDTGYDAQAMTRFLVNRGVPGGYVGPGKSDSTDAFNLPIYLAAGNDTAAIFNSHTDSARSAGKWIIFLVHSILPTDQQWYNPVAIGEITSAMHTAGSDPDVWSDTLVAIAAYWRAQKVLQAVTPVAAGDATTWTWTLPAHFPPGKYLRVTVDGGTLAQASGPLAWDEHGYYEVALDAGTLTLTP